MSRRVQIADSQPPKNDDVKTTGNGEEDDGGDSGSLKLRPSERNTTEDQEPFMGVKVRRKASLIRDYRGDYLDVRSRPYLLKILEKQGSNCFDSFYYFFDLHELFFMICFIML